MLTLLLLLAPAFAKDPCKVIRTADDPLNGAIAGYVQYFDIGHYTAIDLQRSKGEWKMHLMTLARGVSEVHGAPGDLTRIAVGGEVIEIPASKDTLPISNASVNAEIFTQWQVEYAISQEQLVKLGSAPVAAISVFVGPNETRMPLTAKGIEQLQVAFGCAANLPP